MPKLPEVVDSMVRDTLLTQLRLQTDILAILTQVEMVTYFFRILTGCYRSVERQEKGVQTRKRSSVQKLHRRTIHSMHDRVVAFAVQHQTSVVNQMLR